MIHSRSIQSAFGLVAVGFVATTISFCYAQRQPDSQQQRPRVVSGSTAAGQTVTVQPGQNLQKAIDAAQPGDTIMLVAGKTYNGPITLPNKSGDSESRYITIQTSNMAGISPENSRIQPDKHSVNMPKILAPQGESSVLTAPGAHHFKFVGIEFTSAPTANYVYNMINLGSDEYKSSSELPHHIVFDRCFVHSTGLGKARRGFALNCGETSIVNSYISGFAGDGDETQGIAGWNGSGPFHIINNYIEGGGQNIFFGGGDPQVKGLVPSDVEILRNYIFKPAEWKGKATIKAIFEMKNVRRLKIDGNLIVDAHTTTAFALTVRNQNGTAPWSTVEDVEITNNIIQHANMAVNILGRDNYHPSEQAKRIRIANNLFIDIGVDNAAFVQTSLADSITIENNTVQHTGNVITSYGGPTTKFVFRNNIVQNNSYGISCEGSNMANCLPGAVFTKNVVVDNLNSAAQGYPLDRVYPAGNFFPRSLQEVGFVNIVGGDFRLNPTSHFRNRGTDGKDIGVDFNQLQASGATTASEELK